ncbi:MAG: thioredoxin family protein [Duncaniella sp.]|nr:thioredoxin family protein [Duncaniella sp.]
MKAIYMCMAAVAMMMTACGSKTSTENTTEAVEEGVENLVETPEITEANYERGTGVIVYTPTKFPAEVQPDKELPVVIDFNATWCGPCKRFEPVFEASAKAHPEAIYLSIDVDDNPKAAEQFGVHNIPMVVVLMPDGTTRSQVGAMDEAEFAEFLGF